MPVQIIGVGNELRGDDGAALEAVRLIRATPERSTPEPIAVSARCGDPFGLIDIWRRAPAVVLVDAMRSGMRPGAIRRFDAGRDPLPVAFGGAASTHAAGLEEAIELARVLCRLPPRLIVYGIEGRGFEPGTDLSDPVRAALPSLVQQVLGEARRLVLTAGPVARQATLRRPVGTSASRMLRNSRMA